MNTFEHRGLWYLPNKPRRRLPGTLRFSPEEGARLELIGTFQREPEINIGLLEPTVISGISTDGKRVTLYECTETYSTVWNSTNSPGSSLYRAGCVLVGMSLRTIEDLKLQGSAIEYAHLDEWVNTDGFDIDIARDLKRAAIKYNLPKRIEAANLDAYKVFIGFRCKWPILSRIQTEAIVRQTVSDSLRRATKG